LIFPYLTITAMFILSIMATGQWAWERIDPSRRNRSTWIARASDYIMGVAYIGALLSIPSVYYDAWKAGIPGPNRSYTAQTVLFIFALSLTAVALWVSARPAIRLWKETSSLPMINRGLWSLRAFFCPFLVLDAFDAWRKSGGVFSGKLRIGGGTGRV